MHEKLAARGLTEPDQLACLLASRPHLLTSLAGLSEAQAASWRSQASALARLDSGQLAGASAGRRTAWGVIPRKRHPSALVGAVGAVTLRLATQRLRHHGLPREVDLTGSIPFIHDQGANSSCVGHAASAVIEIASAEVLSGSYLYLQCKQIDGGAVSEGTTLECGVRALVQRGTCRLATWPGEARESEPLRGLESVSAEAVAEAAGFCLPPGSNEPLGTVEDLKTALAYGTNGAGRAVLAAVPVYASWDAAFRTGAVPLRLGAADALLGYHAITLVGYRDDEDEPGGGRFLFQNSWGEDWAAASPARAGTGSLPYLYFSENEVDAWYLEPGPAARRSVLQRAGRSGALPALGLLTVASLMGVTWVYSLPEVISHQPTPAPVTPRPIVRVTNRGAASQPLSSTPPRQANTLVELDEERAILDHDLADYVRHVLQQFPEARAGFSTQGP